MLLDIFLLIAVILLISLIAVQNYPLGLTIINQKGVESMCGGSDQGCICSGNES